MTDLRQHSPQVCGDVVANFPAADAAAGQAALRHHLEQALPKVRRVHPTQDVLARDVTDHAVQPDPRVHLPQRQCIAVAAARSQPVRAAAAAAA